MPGSRVLAAALASLAAVALAACAPGALEDEPTSAPPAPSGAPADPSPSAFEPAPTVAPTTAPAAGDLDLACVDVLSLDEVYDFNPEMLGTSQPAGGIPADLRPYADDGLVCAWQHATSGDVLLVGVLRADARDDDTPIASPPGASAVVGDWRIAVASPYFEGASAEAEALLQRVAANLD